MTDVIGLDLSLTCTGVAGRDFTAVIKPKPRHTGLDRMRWLTREILTWMPRRGGLVIIEGPAYSKQAGQAGHHERAGLWWRVLDAVDAAGYRTAVITPTCLKRYATGKGVGDKAAMVLAAARRFPWFDGGADEADALWLAAAGADHLGRPMADLPVTHRAALTGVAWPAENA